jgi:hypothetical protein
VARSSAFIDGGGTLDVEVGAGAGGGGALGLLGAADGAGGDGALHDAGDAVSPRAPGAGAPFT